MSIVKLENINKHYVVGEADYHVLKDVNLVVNPGEFVGVVGTSGSGKSTLMNIMGLLDQATSGRYFLNDHDVFTLSEDDLAHMRNQLIGFVFQSFFLLPRMTALQNVGLPLLYRNIEPAEIKQRAFAMLEKVGLVDFCDRKPNQLSGGQQQRVAIARALVGQPHLLLADEPTGALDTRTSEEIMSLFLDLNQQDKTTVILITHEAKIAGCCQRVISIEDGRLREPSHLGIRRV